MRVLALCEVAARDADAALPASAVCKLSHSLLPFQFLHGLALSPVCLLKGWLHFGGNQEVQNPALRKVHPCICLAPGVYLGGVGPREGWLLPRLFQEESLTLHRALNRCK